jgi:hypothetical protein
MLYSMSWNLLVVFTCFINMLAFLHCQIQEEFAAITKCTKRLHVEWQQFKPLVLTAASEQRQLGGLLSTVTDDMDEGWL